MPGLLQKWFTLLPFQRAKFWLIKKEFGGAKGTVCFVGFGKRGEPGFTMVEVMIYVALVTVAMVVLANFAADVIQNAARSRVVKEVELNAQLTLNRIASEVRHAQSITSVTTDTLTLVDPTDTTVILRFDSINNEVEREVGGLTEAITTSDIRVTSLSFSAVREGVAITITAAQGPVSVPAAYQHATNLATTAFPRQLLY